MFSGFRALWDVFGFLSIGFVSFIFLSLWSSVFSCFLPHAVAKPTIPQDMSLQMLWIGISAPQLTFLHSGKKIREERTAQSGSLGSDSQGESSLHQTVVTILCRLPLRGIGPFPVPEPPPFPPPFCGKSYYFYRISCMNPLFSPTRKLGAKGDAKWWTSISVHV